MKGSIVFKKGGLYYLDQTKLPLKETYKECTTLSQGYRAIKELKIRGAPLIGVFAAYCVYIGVKKFKGDKKVKFFNYFDKIINYLKDSRPTAVNLFWALQRIQTIVYANTAKNIDGLKKLILREAKMIHAEDIRLCSRMADNGVNLIKSGDRILTHCNTGFLATSGEGTALAVIYKAHRLYKNIRIYVDETRPLLQGARLSAWELIKKGVDVTLITDNMAAYLMQQKKVDKIFVGADRITSFGDLANKIGTYNLAVLAEHHGIPFYVVAPLTSFDLTLEEGGNIPIEERNASEVRTVLNKVQITPRKVKVYNPAFDITPHRYIRAIVTDKGIINPPFRENILRVARGEGRKGE